MTASQTATGTAKKNQKTSRSSTFISKVASPFTTKQWSSVEQEIRLDEPYRKHFPGDIVKGAVHLNVTKPTRATHLVVRLHGFVKVINGAKTPGQSIPYDENLLTSTKGRRGIEYFGNGFARLFEDEITLCGDGRLLGQYVFKFELALPSKNIPSSISFEHGTISYLVTSTLTRPTSISPMYSVHRTINVIENIDIAYIKKPEPHIVTVEVVGKKAKSLPRTRRRSIIMSIGKESDWMGVEGSNDVSHSHIRPLANDAPPRSPVPSEISGASLTSSANSGDNEEGNKPQLVTHGSNSTDCSGNVSSSERLITAQTELLQGACVSGDVLPIKVSIDHIKAIKSMQGLIVTLYRQGRIDTHPALPQGQYENENSIKCEDYYPKSFTGLGGLSLRSAGSSRTFRQDLAQRITPLIVDPKTLTATVKTSIQVPEHVFPTISCVPGAMVSFRYYVEVVIDLRGRLASQDKFLPRLNMINDPKHAYGDPKISNIVNADGINFSSTPGFNYLITDQIRRTKGVVFTATEVIVGTHDSLRMKGKQKQSSEVAHAGSTREVYDSSQDERPAENIRSAYCRVDDHVQESEYHPIPDEAEHPVPYLAPPPEIGDELDEKSQIRRAEQRLLPSAPPNDGPSATAQVASAPPALDEEDFVHQYALQASAPAYDPSPPPPFVNSTVLNSQSRDNQGHVHTSSFQPSNEDKQELERRRLQALASCPGGPSEEGYLETNAPQPSAPAFFEP